MKQKDIALIAVVAVVSAFFALLVSKFFFSTPQNRKQTAEVVDIITPNFPEPPTQYFNVNAINPTQQIEIGNTTNPNPFNSKPQ